MLNTQYSHYELADPEELSDARYKWGPSEIVEEVKELKRAGFNSRTWGFVDVEKQATTQCLRHRALLAELEQLTKDLLTAEKLIAFGFTKDTFAGPQYILPATWKFAKVNYDASTLEIEGQPESRITNIVVFEELKNPQSVDCENNKSGSKRSLKEEYIFYVQELIESDQRSSRELTYSVMQERWGEAATYGRLKPLRKKYYPSKWKRGRPKKKAQNNRGDNK